MAVPDRRRVVAAAIAVVAACGSSGRDVDRACDPAAQDCGAAMKCNPYGPPPPEPWDGTACVDDNADGGSPAGTPCFTGPDATDTCGPDATCIQLGFGEGVCTAFCSDAAPCPSGERCVSWDDDLGLTLCAAECDGECPILFGCVDGVCLPTSRF